MGVMTITHQFGTFNHIKQSQNTLGVKYGHYSSKTIPKPRGVSLFMVTLGGQIPTFWPRWPPAAITENQ